MLRKERVGFHSLSEKDQFSLLSGKKVVLGAAGELKLYIVAQGSFYDVILTGPREVVKMS